LREQFQAVRLPLIPEAQSSLKDHVYAYVDKLKALGWLPERIIISVKQLAWDAGIRTSAVAYSPSRTISGPDALMAQVIGWVIGCYYGLKDRD
jgi:hypothetical protein